MENSANQEKTVIRFSFIISIATAVATLATFSIAIMTPPLSGPFCTGTCFKYPYTGIISRFPRDYIWMYPAMAVPLLSVILIICIRYNTIARKRIFTETGLTFAVVSASILVSNYFVQVSVIQPALLHGETEGIAILTQYNPHGVFIALEEIGYLLMTIALFCIVPVFNHKNRLHLLIQLIFTTGFFLAVFSLVLISSKHGVMREYLFEVAIISIVFLELIFSSLLLSSIFWKTMQSSTVQLPV